MELDRVFANRNKFTAIDGQRRKKRGTNYRKESTEREW